MPLKLVKPVRDYPALIYIEIPKEIRQKFNLKSGDFLLCQLKNILDRNGNIKATIENEVTWEVGGLPYMLVIPREIVEHHSIEPGGLFEPGDSLEIELKEVKKKNGLKYIINS